MLKISPWSLFRLQLLLMPHIAHYKRTHHKDFRKLIEKNHSLSKLTLTLAVITPLMTLPQIYEICISQRTTGVSGLSWGFYVFSSSIWFLYAIKIKDRALYISSALWVIVQAIVVLGLVIN
jgi:uncharacterized protein with PQ loop repeat